MFRQGFMSVVVVSGLALAAPVFSQQDPLQGHWEGTVETPQGQRPVVANFEKGTAGYTGNITGMRGEIPFKDIKVTGNNVSAEAEVQSPAGNANIKYTFTVEGETLKGKGEANFGGQPFAFNYDMKRTSTTPAAVAPAGAGTAPAGGAAAAGAAPARTGGLGGRSVPQPLQKQSLEYFTGRWNFRWVGRESAVSPGGVVEGTMVLTALPDSDYLEGRLEGKTKTGPMGDKVLLGFDDAKKAVVLLEQRAPSVQTLSLGDWSSPLAIRFKVAPFQAGTQKLRLRRTLSVVAGHSFTIAEELSENGGPFVRLGDAVFSRAEGAAPPAAAPKTN